MLASAAISVFGCSESGGGISGSAPNASVMDATAALADGSGIADIVAIPDASSLPEVFLLSGQDAACSDAAGTSVDPSILQGAVPACSQGYAHPNVCCEGNPRAATVCIESPGTPFEPCGYAALTFPDPRTCCALDGGLGCVPAPSLPSDGDGGTKGCHYPCGAGGYPPSLLAGLADPGQELPACTGVPSVASNRGIVVPQGFCEYCCVNIPNAPGSVTSYGCAGTPANLECGACPDGWRPAQGVPDLCCRSAAAGFAQCFSQAVVINDNGSQ
jgi:hypothetical protein